MLAALVSLAPGLGSVLGPMCEVVVHDLRNPETSIVAIANGHVTGRGVGDPVIGGPQNDVALKWLTSNSGSGEARVYLTKTKDGRTLKSATTLYRYEGRRPYAAFCINVDLTIPMLVRDWTEGMISAEQMTASDDGDARTDVDQVLAEMIDECLRILSVPPTNASREDRLRIVTELDNRGAFLVRGAVKRVAEELGISPFTVYSYLEATRDNED